MQEQMRGARRQGKMRRTFFMRRVLAFSRFLIVVAVVGCFVCACGLLFYGAKETFVLAAGTFSGALGGKKLLLHSIEAVDVFLLATVFYIIALGLYELFVDDTIPVPAWLEIHTLKRISEEVVHRERGLSSPHKPRSGLAPELSPPVHLFEIQAGWKARAPGEPLPLRYALDDLKAKLLGVVATILGVLFLGQVVSWDGERNLGPYGVAIAAVILAITLDARKKS